MARALSFMSGTDSSQEGWSNEDGWPYADADAPADELDPADPSADVDDDLVALHVTGEHLFDGLDQLERTVLVARFGFDGGPARSMREIQQDLGIPRAELRHALGDGLAKVRGRLL
jgi:DNA-directed RNA polymerase sigma subunit (sigma70/sigma32)